MSKVPDRISRRKPQYASKTWFPVPCKTLHNYPIESVLKVTLSVIGAVVEVSHSRWKLFDVDGNVSSVNVIYFAYATVFTMFGFTGVMEILLRLKKLKLPPTSGHMTLALAYLTEGLLFYYHVQDKLSFVKKARLEPYMHILIYFVAFVSAVVTFFEIQRPKSFSLSFTRCFLTLLQGTWFFQSGFVLFSKRHWDHSKEGNLMLVPILFVWHIFSVLVFSLLMYCLVSCAVSKYKNRQDRMYEDDSFNSKRDHADSIPLSIVLNGNAGISDESEMDSTHYP